MSFCDDTLVPEHEASLHFQYLVDPEHGLLTMGGSLEEHARQLAGVLAGPPADMLQRQRRFVRDFIRPHGIEVSATHLVTDALERLPAAPRAAAPTPSTLGKLGWLQVQRLERNPRWRQLILDEREIARETRVMAKARLREQDLMRKRAAKQLALAKKRAAKVR
jgi:hypothetical protein